MRALWYAKAFLAAGLAVLVITGCSEFVNVSDRSMTVQDIINMTKAGVGQDAIMRQIEVTHSKFRLDPNQIIQLKEANVEDKVIEAMIESGDVPEYFSWEFGYSPFDYWHNYYNQWLPTYNYFPYNYSYYSRGAPYAFPYTVYRQRDFLGRFYKYVPINPPQWGYNEYRFKHPGTRIPQEEETED